MSVLEIESPHFSDVVKWVGEPEVGIQNKSVTLVNTSSTAPVTFPVGTVVGKITASGKYTISKSGAGDGSQTPAGVLIANGAGVSTHVTLAASGEELALILADGPAILSGAALTLGTGTTLAAVKTAFADLKIVVEDTI